MFYTEDEDLCMGCGIRMDVIGPPGPQHAYSCPEAVRERQSAHLARIEEAEFIARHIGVHACGCVVTRNGIEKPCFQPDCRILNPSPSWNRDSFSAGTATFGSGSNHGTQWSYNNQSPSMPTNFNLKDPKDAFILLENMLINSPAGYSALQTIVTERDKMQTSFMEISTKWIPPSIHDGSVRDAKRDILKQILHDLVDCGADTPEVLAVINKYL